MRRMIHVWVCVALAYCQPAPSIAAEPDIIDGKPIIRLSADEARACMADGVCLLLTRAQYEAAVRDAVEAGERAERRRAVDRSKQCGRDA